MVSRLLMSQMFQSSTSIMPSGESACKSLKLMLYNNLIQPSSPGVYTLMPTLVRSLEKLTALVDQAMTDIGGQKCIMPTLGAKALWSKTGRWDEMDKELFQLRDRMDRQYCLSPTHEEEITSIVASKAKFSYKSLPLKLYQMTTKFRDEPSPKYGIIRGREFLMKDLYTFDADKESAEITYNAVCETYCSIFKLLDIPYLQVTGDTGAMGGSNSHEFHLLTGIGEDTLSVCKSCGKGLNNEILGNDKSKTFHCGSPNCPSEFQTTKGIEVGHCFLLGEKYSKALNATFVNMEGNIRNLYMGCYGIGVTRLLAASLELLSTDDELRWPKAFVPFRACLIPQKDGAKDALTSAELDNLYSELSTPEGPLRKQLITDDRVALTIGRRLVDVTRLGFPFAVIAKKSKDREGIFELIDTYNKKSHYLTVSEIVDRISEHFDHSSNSTSSRKKKTSTAY